MNRGRTCATALLMAATLVAIGCPSGPSKGGTVDTGSFGVAANQETVATWNVNGECILVAAELNQYRAQSGLGGFPMVPSDVLYTVAVRHAGYLDSVNSSNGIVGPDTGTITVENDIIDLFSESVAPIAPSAKPPVITNIDGVFPIFFTHNDLRRRVLAVVGGPDLLAMGSTARNVFECYLIKNQSEMLNNITTPGTPVLSNFRGLGGQGSLLSSVNYTYAQNLWYHPAWRVPLMRASMRYMGFSSVADARLKSGLPAYQPPYPLLSGNGPQAFGGVLTLVEDPMYPVVGSIWPGAGSAIRPYGFDGDQDPAQTVYPWLSGPPLHYIVPTIEYCDTVTVGLTRDDAGNLTFDPSAGGTATPGDDHIYVFGNTLNVALPVGSDFTPAPGTDLFYGDAGAVGGGGTGSVNNVTLATNVGILFIDNYTAGTAPDHINNNIIDHAYFNLGAPSRILATVQLSAALPATVQLGDTMVIPPYSEPLEFYNPGDQADVLGHNDGSFAIFWISNDRTYVQLAVQPSNTDEVAASLYNSLADPTPDTNATCNITGLRTTAGGGNALANLRNGEFLFIPADPLVPGGTYTLTVSALTITGRAFPSQTRTFTVTP